MAMCDGNPEITVVNSLVMMGGINFTTMVHFD